MEDSITVGIKELKNKLSAYIKAVAAGSRIFVTDRNVIVAELVQPFLSEKIAATGNIHWQRWVQSGLISPARREKPQMEMSDVKIKGFKSGDILDELRGER